MHTAVDFGHGLRDPDDDERLWATCAKSKARGVWRELGVPEAARVG